jgi:uncharacterized integral membrane protein
MSPLVAFLLGVVAGAVLMFIVALIAISSIRAEDEDFQ